MSLMKRSVAELVGTSWLVFGGCGSVVLAAAFLSYAPVFRGEVETIAYGR